MTTVSHHDTPVLNVALLGGGTVGSQVARILTEDSELLTERIGARLNLAGVFVRNTAAQRDYQLPSLLYTTDAEELISRADIVIELMGGIDPARELILAAINRGAAVVTGNKALLATHGTELFTAAADQGVQLSFEASVCGAIPILRPLRDSLSGDRVTRVMGIANGTTNYILDQMDTTGISFGDALAEAQRLGYAEADPTADIAGHDAAAKVAILASLAFQAPFTLDQVDCQGITTITAEDNEAAAAAGFVIKLLAIAERVSTNGDDGVVLRVHPTLLPREHPLAAVRGAYNAVFVEAENAGELMFYGAGAGGEATASAVMGDVVSIAKRLQHGGPGRPHTPKTSLDALEIGHTTTSYMIVVHAADQPGVLATVASLFAEQGVSIETMQQAPAELTPLEAERAAAAGETPQAVLRFITHRGLEQRLADTVAAIEELDVVSAVTSVLRVEGN
ncbi:homoserine dehydrogenase [Citricoccus muralis]|uniref:Homoserine dehydrogenase n=1 Tax=Citricoccus muralis TaxID=169134 RepID=A0ABY8H938_9MICC|nr:homoserine dehydrogenase [Citricoccus muralis]WFP17677.1 homoserine dehydrogenase [Citricoccus muralis]